METLAIISTSLSLAEHLYEYITSLVNTAKQDAELTPEQEAEIDARMAATFASPAWQPRIAVVDDNGVVIPKPPVTDPIG